MIVVLVGLTSINATLTFANWRLARSVRHAITATPQVPADFVSLSDRIRTLEEGQLRQLDAARRMSASLDNVHHRLDGVVDELVQRLRALDRPGDHYRSL